MVRKGKGRAGQGREGKRKEGKGGWEERGRKGEEGLAYSHRHGPRKT